MSVSTLIFLEILDTAEEILLWFSDLLKREA